ncbi:MAG: hypothetical protein AAB886_00115 [Patescibacteria group bacterium]
MIFVVFFALMIVALGVLMFAVVLHKYKLMFWTLAAIMMLFIIVGIFGQAWIPK